MEKLQRKLLSGDHIIVDGKKYESETHIKDVLSEGECEPEYLCENIPVGCRMGKCSCDTVVRSFENFCSHCGKSLLWGNVHA